MFSKTLTLLALLFVSSHSLAETLAGKEDAQAIARLYSATFDREPKVAGLNFWINSFESGRSMVDIASEFYLSDEFTAKYGALNNVSFVGQLFLNVLGREGAQEGITFWEGHLDSERLSRAAVLSRFAESPENVIKTDVTYAAMERGENGDWAYDIYNQAAKLTLTENSLFGEREKSLPYLCTLSNCSKTSNATIIGASTIKHSTYILTATGKDYVIHSLIARESRNVTVAGFDGLEEGMIISAGTSVEFSLTSGLTGGRQASLFWSFEVDSLGVQFSDVLSLTTN